MSPIPKKTAMSTTIASVKDTVAHPQVRVHTVREAFSLPALYQRLGVSTVTLPPYGWLAPLLLTLVATLLRFWNLAHPNAIVFDETYYAKDAYSMLHFGYEKNWSDQANDSFVAGNPTGISDSPEYVVHPPVGKWMIAFGMFLFGDNNPFGWRFSAALIGSLSIGLLMLAAWLLFRSISVASLAGLIMAVDGLHLVQSRFALLDIFLMFWLLAAFVCLLLDRQQSRRTLAQKVCAHSQKKFWPTPAGLSQLRALAGRALLADSSGNLRRPGRGSQMECPILYCHFWADDPLLGPQRPPASRY